MRLGVAGHGPSVRFFAHSRDKIFGHLIVNVCLQQSQTHLSQCVRNVALRNGPMAAEVLENVLKPVG